MFHMIDDLKRVSREGSGYDLYSVEMALIKRNTHILTLSIVKKIK